MVRRAPNPQGMGSSMSSTEIQRAIGLLRKKLRQGQEGKFCGRRFRGAGDRCRDCSVVRSAHDLLEVIDVLIACRDEASTRPREPQEGKTP